MKKGNERACFAAGCFWGVEYVFKTFPGIVITKVGYTGGHVKTPSYQEVCTGITGHAEALYLEFDPKKITYKKLLEIFFKCHDPTTMNQQGPDMGTQYRSAIFYYDEKQKSEAEKAKKDFQKILKKKIVTEIVPAKEFYEAEDYHQRYYEKKGSEPYCHIVPRVKI